MNKFLNEINIAIEEIPALQWKYLKIYDIIEKYLIVTHCT